MEVEVHDEAIEPLLGEWAALFAADPRATPFSSHLWAQAWWPHWAAGARPFVVTVRDGGRLVGLAPLVVRRRGPLRLLRMLGREPADYWDVLAVPEARQEVTERVAAALARGRGEWDALILDALPSDSATGAALEAAGLRVRRRRPIPCPGIELPGTFDDYLATLPRSRRGNLRQHLRRLDRGEVELREVRSPQELPGAIDAWQRIRVQRWDEMGKDLYDEHRSGRFRDFMRDVTLLLVPAGMALVWEFSHAGEVIGVEVNFVDARSFYLYLGGFDPRFARLGLGKISIGHGIRSSIEAGRAYYDFAQGSEPYKYWYGAQDRLTPSLVVGTARPRSLAAVAAGAAAVRLRR